MRRRSEAAQRFGDVPKVPVGSTVASSYVTIVSGGCSHFWTRFADQELASPRAKEEWAQFTILVDQGWTKVLRAENSSTGSWFRLVFFFALVFCSTLKIYGYSFFVFKFLPCTWPSAFRTSMESSYLTRWRSTMLMGMGEIIWRTISNQWMPPLISSWRLASEGPLPLWRSGFDQWGSTRRRAQPPNRRPGLAKVLGRLAIGGRISENEAKKYFWKNIWALEKGKVPHWVGKPFFDYIIYIYNVNIFLKRKR